MDEIQHIPFLPTKDGLLQHILHSKPVDDLLEFLQQCVVYMTRYTHVAGHLADWKMILNLRPPFQWVSMSGDPYKVVKNCTSCTRERIEIQMHATQLKLFPGTEPLTYVPIDILDLLIEINNGSIALLAVPNQLSKLTGTVPSGRSTAQDIAAAFTTQWVFLYGPPSILLADIGT